jgi:hypothetical protein
MSPPTDNQSTADGIGLSASGEDCSEPVPSLDSDQELLRRLHELTKAGNVVGALEVTREAVSQWRTLVMQDSRFTPDLARSLGHLVVRTNRAGRFGEALAAASESVKYWKLAADQDLERHGLDLSHALMRLALFAGGGRFPGLTDRQRRGDPAAAPSASHGRDAIPAACG